MSSQLVLNGLLSCSAPHVFRLAAQQTQEKHEKEQMQGLSQEPLQDKGQPSTAGTLHPNRVWGLLVLAALAAALAAIN
jgi:hypothetical protein